jgi:small subunit ribosomal protein S2
MAAAMYGSYKALIAGSRGVVPAVRAAAGVGTSPHLRSGALSANEARRYASNTHYYGALERHLRGSAGAKPKPVDLPYIDQVRAEHLLKLRFHIGHQRRKLDKHMGGTIHGFRHNIAIFDIAKTWKSLRTVFYAFAEMAQARSSFYLLAPNKALPLRPLIEKMRNEYPFRSNKFSSLYMVGYSDQKWVDGTFSNWKQTYAFYEHVRKVLKNKPSLQKFRRLAKYMRGIDSVDLMGRVVPDFMLVFATDRGAIHEATNLDVPLIGMVDSNTSPLPFLYPVFGNDDSLESIQFMMDVLKRAVEEGRKREHEAFAIMLVQKLKQKLNPAHATADAMPRYPGPGNRR